MSGYQVSNPVFSVVYNNAGNAQQQLLAVQQGITKQYASSVTASGNSVDAPTVFGFTQVNGTPNFGCDYMLPSAAAMIEAIRGFYQASIGTQGLYSVDGISFSVPKGLTVSFQVHNNTNTYIELDAPASVSIQQCDQFVAPGDMMLLTAVVLNSDAGSESVKVIKHSCSVQPLLAQPPQ